MKILVTGSRNWTNYRAMIDVLKGLPKDTQLVHGGCRGADTMAGNIAGKLGMPDPKIYYADWKRYGRGAGPKRNQLMLDDNPDISKIIAFHEDINKSKGTRDMVNRGKRAGIEVVTITG